MALNDFHYCLSLGRKRPFTLKIKIRHAKEIGVEEGIKFPDLISMAFENGYQAVNFSQENGSDHNHIPMTMGVPSNFRDNSTK